MERKGSEHFGMPKDLFTLSVLINSLSCVCSSGKDL